MRTPPADETREEARAYNRSPWLPADYRVISFPGVPRQKFSGSGLEA
jgi:hypothetical protein